MGGGGGAPRESPTSALLFKKSPTGALLFKKIENFVDLFSNSPQSL